jgi:hypothetical protein
VRCRPAATPGVRARVDARCGGDSDVYILNLSIQLHTNFLSTFLQELRRFTAARLARARAAGAARGPAAERS